MRQMMWCSTYRIKISGFIRPLKSTWQISTDLDAVICMRIIELTLKFSGVRASDLDDS